MKNKITFLNKNTYSNNFKQYKLDKKFVYKIEKYDNNSLLVKLFKLNETKVNYYTYFRKQINNPKRLNEFSLEKSSEYNFMLFKKKEQANKINKEFKKSINASEISKYKSFYMSEYNGLEGLKKHSNRQKMFFNARQQEAEDRLKDKLYFSSFFANSGNLNYKEKQIKSKRVLPNFTYAQDDSYEICNYKKTNNKLWISGFYKKTTGTIQGFTAFSEDFFNIKKLNKSKKTDTSSIVNFLVEDYSDGAFSIETSIGTSIKNTLLKFDNFGKLISKKVLPFSKIPRYMTYDDINNSIIIVFSGTNIDATKDADNEQILYNLNFEDEFKNFTVKLKAKAYVFDIIKLNNEVLVFSNFVNYSENNSLIYSNAGSSSKSTNLLITSISKAEIVKQTSFTNKQAFFGTKAIKINSNLINVLGFKTTYKNNNFNELKNVNLYSLFLNSKLKSINVPWHD